MQRDETSRRQGYTASSYLKVLKEAIPTLWEPDLTFMQDNAPIHTARVVTEWFQERGIPILPWPPYSPDLNPIGHCWAKLKEKVLELYPDLETQGVSEEAREEMIRAIKSSWDQLTHMFMKKLVWSMQRRVDAVLKAKGCYTKY